MVNWILFPTGKANGVAKVNTLLFVRFAFSPAADAIRTMTVVVSV
jgi:hypothetical protein